MGCPHPAEPVIAQAVQLAGEVFEAQITNNYECAVMWQTQKQLSVQNLIKDCHP